jgi:putative hydrolase of the HAD superfamily
MKETIAPPADEITRISADFQDKDTWVFDLDNTLYPAQCNLFAQIDDLMGSFVAEFLDVDRIEARRIQKSYYREYGTTLNGLMTCHDLDPHHYLNYVHNIDLAPISHDNALNEALTRLPGRKLILTNGSVKHAENVAGKLGILHHFDDIFDIVAADFVPKPEQSTYEKFLKRADIDPQSAAMFEDLARNLKVPHDLGMKTILVCSPPEHKDGEMDMFNGIDRDAEHVHYVTEHLSNFLNVILQAIAVKS